MAAQVFTWSLLTLAVSMGSSTVYKCYPVDEEVTFCMDEEAPQLQCPVGNRLSIRWAELRRAQGPCRRGTVMPSREACFLQRVTTQLKQQCDNHLLCQPRLQQTPGTNCPGDGSRDFLHIWYRCNSETLGQQKFHGMCDAKTVTDSVVHLSSAGNTEDIGCSCSVLVPGNTEVEVLAQQTLHTSRRYSCPQKLHIQDETISKDLCLPSTGFGVVTQMSCLGAPQHLTLFYTHIKVTGHALTLKASFNVNLTVTCGPIQLNTAPPTPRQVASTALHSSNSKIDSQSAGMALAGQQTAPGGQQSSHRNQPVYDTAVLGGVVGATMCVILILSAILVYLLWQRRQENKRYRKKTLEIEDADGLDEAVEEQNSSQSHISTQSSKQHSVRQDDQDVPSTSVLVTNSPETADQTNMDTEGPSKSNSLSRYTDSPHHPEPRNRQVLPPENISPNQSIRNVSVEYIPNEDNYICDTDV